MNPRTRGLVVAMALSWLGTPFVHSQGVKGVGVDCVQLVKQVGVESGFQFSGDLPVYGMTPDYQVMQRELNKHLDPIPFRGLQIADLLWFKSEGMLHLGIVIETNPLTVVHAYNGKNRKEVIRTRVYGDWRHNINGCFRYRGIED